MRRAQQFRAAWKFPLKEQFYSRPQGKKEEKQSKDALLKKKPMKVGHSLSPQTMKSSAKVTLFLHVFRNLFQGLSSLLVMGFIELEASGL